MTTPAAETPSPESGAEDREPNPPEQQQQPEPARPAQDTTDWRAEAKKWEGRAKENAAAKKRLDELEEASKTELQKATERAETAEKRVAELEKREQVRIWTAEVAAEFELSAESAAALRGDTREELEAHAAQLQVIDRHSTSPYRPDPIQGRTRAAGATGPFDKASMARRILSPGRSGS
jgi:hypothetical protein